MILGAVALDARLAYAFGAGMVAAINPCGFAMLPAYLSYFVGAEENRGDTGGRPLARAAGVTAVMTLGFIVVFALAGSVLSQLYQRLAGQTGWATLVIGLLLVGFGIALIAGKELVVQLPKLSRGGSTRGLGSMFLFGVSYAIASLSCTITVFIATIASTFNQRGVLAGFAVFVAYGLGMGTLIGILTAAVAMAHLG